MVSQNYYHLDENSTFFFFQIQVILEIGKKILEIERDYFQVSCVFAFEVYCDPYVRKLPTVVVMIADL